MTVGWNDVRRWLYNTWSGVVCARGLLANINNTILLDFLFPRFEMTMVVAAPEMVILRRLLNDDIPHAALRLSTDQSLCVEATAQKVDAPQSLPPLSWIRTDTVLKRLEDLRLPSPAHGIILVTLHCRAEVEVDGKQDILDGDDGTPRREARVRGNVKLPGKVANTNRQRL